MSEEERLVVRALSVSVQHRTFADEDAAVFRRFHTALSELFPLVFSRGRVQVADERGLLICLSGGQGARPLLFLSHMDVVPARFEDRWMHPPFAGRVADGYVYGRGTLDMKGHLCALLTAAETLLQSGWQPKGDIYFAFSADEEKRGESMKNLCDLLRAAGVEPAFVLDEGGCVTGYTRLHKAPAALVGVAEKGRVVFSLTTQADVGAERLLRAGSKVSAMRFKPRLTGEVEKTLELLSPLAGAPLKTPSRHLANPFFRLSALHILLRMREMQYAVRSQVSLLRLSGDALDYERPTLVYSASLLQGDEAQAFVKRLEKLLRRDGVNIRVERIEEPSCVSPAEGPAWEAVETAINVHFPHVPVVPYLIQGGTDARRMEPICPYIYRFSPFLLSPEETARIHRTDERISVENLTRGVQFFKQILQA